MLLLVFFALFFTLFGQLLESFPGFFLLFKLLLKKLDLVFRVIGGLWSFDLLSVSQLFFKHLVLSLQVIYFIEKMLFLFLNNIGLFLWFYRRFGLFRCLFFHRLLNILIPLFISAVYFLLHFLELSFLMFFALILLLQLLKIFSSSPLHLIPLFFGFSEFCM